MQLIEPTTAGEWQQVRELFGEYWRSFGFSPCFQGFAAEVAGLPGAYGPPSGTLVMALVDGKPTGCAAIRRFDGQRAEAKRLFVKPEFRGAGVGRALLKWVIAATRQMGYQEIVGDTIPEMAVALAMYDRSGFERTTPHTANPAPGLIFLSLKL